MAGLKLTPIILKEVNRYLTSPKKVRKFGFDQPPVKTGKDIKRPENPFREFEERNPQADGGRIPFRIGGTDPKTGMGFQKGNPGFTKKGVIKNPTGKNQYGSIRTLKEVQKAINNAPPVLKKGKSVERNPKDLLAESSYVKKKEGGTQYITRKEYDEYKNKLKFKTTGRESFVKETRKKAAKKRSDLTKTKSSPSLETELAAPKKTGLNFHHAGFKESLTDLKNTMYIPGSPNRKMAKLFEDPLIKEMESFTKVFDDVNASPLEKQKAATNYLKNDRALRQKYPEFKNFKTRFSFRRTAFEPGIMVKEKLPNPSLAISQEPGMTLKGETPSTPKGKQILKFAKTDLNRLAAIGCPGKMMGGRIGLNKGQNLTACATKGIEKLKGDPGKLTPGDQANFRKLSKSVKTARLLKNILGPAAIAGEVLIEGGVAANKFMDEGVPIKQALGQSYLNYLLGPKTKIDVEAERAKEFAKGEDFAMAERGRRMAPFMAQSKEADARRLKKRQEQMEQAFPTTSISDAQTILNLAGITQKDTGMSFPEIQDFLKQQDQMKAISDAGGVANLAGGGIAKLAGINKGPQIRSMNPDSQGLSGLLKRGIKTQE